MADFICKNKYLIVIISIILLVFSFIGMNLTKINYDILVYLPDDIETIKGQNMLTDDFNMGGYSIATIENMPAKDILSLEEKIKTVPGVANVMSIYDAIGSSIPIEMVPSEIRDKLHKDNMDIIFITFNESTSNEKTINAVKEIRTITEGKILQGGMSSMVLDTMELSEKEITIYVVIAVLLCIIVLQLSLDSYAVPFILLLNIGCAILFNLGTNIFLGQISYITKALVAVLQLGVTTDFSIFLYHAYENNKKLFKNKEEAMSESIKETFLSVTGSSLTTIVGFLALCAMRLTLGKDLGIVMAKGVLLGVLTVITLFPSLLLVFDNLIKKTKHKEIMPSFNKFNSFIIKHYKVVFVIFLLLIIPTYLANKNVSVYYKLDSSLPDTLESVKTNSILKDKYDIVSPEIILIDKNLKNDDAINMINEIKSLDGIDFVLSFRELKEHGITEDILPVSLTSAFESDKYEMILVNSKYDIATNELNNQIDKLNKIVKSYDKTAIVAGQGPLTKDLVETYDTDYNNVNIFSIGCIFIVLVFVLKSFILPILLIIAIEAAIFINLSVSYFNGTILPFIAPITLGTIQLGATIDYAILVTTNYINKRKEGLNKEKAIMETMNYAAPSILISGMCFFGATFGVGIYSDIEMIGSICTLISRGALISVLVVLTVLPSVLLIFDRFIFRDKEKDRMKKITKASKKMALWLLLIGVILTLLPINALAFEKNESVYGKLNYDGTVKSIIVNEQITNRQKLDKIEDYTELKDILNIKNDAKYSLDNNKITWDAAGKDIFYKGTTDKSLPIDLKITYMLDDKEYTAEDMVGKSGKVTIKLKYTNNDRHGNLYTPFVVTLGTIIDGENNSNVEIINGKVVNNGSNYVAVGIATPGLYQSLGFEELKTLDTITVSYDTTKFELASMYSVITSKLIDENDLSIFDKMDSLYQNINTLQDSMNQIEEGSKKLSNGLETLHTNYYEFNNGLNMVNTNFYTLNSGVNELQRQVNNILNNDKVKEFREYLPILEENANKIKEITNNYSDDINDYLNDSNNVVDGVTNDILNIISYLDTVSEYLDNTEDYSTIITTYTNDLSNYIDNISSYLDTIQNYLNTFDKLSSFTASSADYIIKTYEANPEEASEELTKLYYEAIQIKNSNELANITNSLNNDKINLNELKTYLNDAKVKLNTVSELLLQDDGKLISEIDNVRKSCINLKEIEIKVKEANKNIHTDIGKISNGIGMINELPEKINKIEVGINDFEDGINAISDGTNKLYEGIETLSNYSNQIYEGIGLLNDGSNELSEGITKFNNEGINKISELVDSDVKTTINKIRQLVKLGNNYSSFAGDNTDKNSTTKFIMVIDSLEAPEEQMVVEETKKITFWDRVKNLFN